MRRGARVVRTDVISFSEVCFLIPESQLKEIMSELGVTLNEAGTVSYPDPTEEVEENDGGPYPS